MDEGDRIVDALEQFEWEVSRYHEEHGGFCANPVIEDLEAGPPQIWDAQTLASELRFGRPWVVREAERRRLLGSDTPAAGDFERGRAGDASLIAALAHRLRDAEADADRRWPDGWPWWVQSRVDYLRGLGHREAAPLHQAEEAAAPHDEEDEEGAAARYEQEMAAWMTRQRAIWSAVSDVDLAQEVAARNNPGAIAVADDRWRSGIPDQARWRIVWRRARSRRYPPRVPALHKASSEAIVMDRARIHRSTELVVQAAESVVQHVIDRAPALFAGVSDDRPVATVKLTVGDDESLPVIPGLEDAVTNAIGRIVTELMYLTDGPLCDEDHTTMNWMARDIVYYRLAEAYDAAVASAQAAADSIGQQPIDPDAQGP